MAVIVFNSHFVVPPAFHFGGQASGGHFVVISSHTIVIYCNSMIICWKMENLSGEFLTRMDGRWGIVNG